MPTDINKRVQTIADKSNDTEQQFSAIKQQIESIKTFCSNFPTLKTSFNLKLVDISDAIRFLMNLLGQLLGLQVAEIRDMITQWLIKVLKPLEKNITFILKSNLKTCLACKINPKIPEWMFTDGINLEVDQIDLTCLFRINPNSEVGQMLYDSSSTVDMNRFLWELLETPNTPKNWVDPYTQKIIATFTFYEEASNTNTNFVGYSKSLDTGAEKGKQNVDSRNNVINMKIHSNYNGASFITFLNDYIDSQRPLFTAEKIVPQAMDFIYGVMGKKINLDEGCLEKQAEFDETVENLIKCGADNPNVEINDSFFEFDSTSVFNIKNKVESRKRGVIILDSCDGEESTVSFETVKNFDNRFKKATLKEQKVIVLNNAIDEFAKNSSGNVSEKNQTKAKWSFIENLIHAIKIAIFKVILSPKINVIILTFYYLVNGQARFSSVKDYIKNIMCIIRPLIQELLKKLIYELLLPLVLKALTVLLKCYIKFKINKKKEVFKEQINSMLPFNSLLDLGIDKAFGIVEGAANSAIDIGVDSTQSGVATANNKKQNG